MKFSLCFYLCNMFAFYNEVAWPQFCLGTEHVPHNPNSKSISIIVSLSSQSEHYLWQMHTYDLSHKACRYFSLLSLKQLQNSWKVSQHFDSPNWRQHHILWESMSTYTVVMRGNILFCLYFVNCAIFQTFKYALKKINLLTACVFVLYIYSYNFIYVLQRILMISKH